MKALGSLKNEVAIVGVGESEIGKVRTCRAWASMHRRPSNFRGWCIAEIAHLADQLGIDRPIASEPLYNIGRPPTGHNVPVDMVIQTTQSRLDGDNQNVTTAVQGSFSYEACRRICPLRKSLPKRSKPESSWAKTMSTRSGPASGRRLPRERPRQARSPKGSAPEVPSVAATLVREPRRTNLSLLALSPSWASNKPKRFSRACATGFFALLHPDHKRDDAASFASSLSEVHH
jgi:hypothetical protein